MVVCIHCDLIPSPPLSRRRIAKPAACALQGQALLVSAGTSGSPSLVAFCNKFIPSRACDFILDITPSVSTASHLSAFGVKSLTVGTASDISDFRLFIFGRKRCFSNTRAVHLCEVPVKKRGRRGRSGLRDGDRQHYAALQLHFAQLTNSNCAGATPFSPRILGRVRLVSGRGLFACPNRTRERI